MTPGPPPRRRAASDRAPGRRGATRGLTLVEMLVVLALASVVLVGSMVILTELLQQSRDQVGQAPAVGGPTDITLAFIERDVRRAVGASVPGLLGVGGSELWLRLPDGELVAYASEAGALRRTVRPQGGEPRSRVLLDGVLVGEFALQGRLVDTWIRARGEPLRHRSAVARNLGRAGFGGLAGAERE
jgi:prepilin-type N-terminal cleavage/methylation domain-containing protein